jgi:serine palmitoyltransferase
LDLDTSETFSPSKADVLGRSLDFFVFFFSFFFFFALMDVLDFRIWGGDLAPATKGYAGLVNDFENFFVLRMFARIRDCWDRPICSKPDSHITVMERGPIPPPMNSLPLELTGKTRECLNLGSYNYLGFADGHQWCTEKVIESIEKYGVGVSQTRAEFGTTSVHVELEQLVAQFCGKESAVVFGMGFQTNSTVLPFLVGRGGLIISDALNHASLVAGCKCSPAKIMMFRHNDVEHLEKVVRDAIAMGQPRTRRPWTKILIVVEGIYSMEGEICRLPEIVRIKKKYGCYIYMDEAHSIGALGGRGRGICDHWGVNPADVDILMGTFTKSFGAVGGYIAADRDVVAHVRASSYAMYYDVSLPAGCAEQALRALMVMSGMDGSDLGISKISQLKRNANYFRKRLDEEGFTLLGDYESPVIPLMLYLPSMIAAFSRECLIENIATVVVGFPATPLLLARSRFCISASHTIEDLEEAVKKISAVGDRLGLKYL